MTYIQSNLIPLDQSPFPTSDRLQPVNYDELLEYGTDADCRMALASLVDILDGDDLDSLPNSVKELEKERDEAQETLSEYQEFFNDCVQISEEYSGWFPCAEPHNFLPVISDTFQEWDEYKTALINIRQAIKDGESLEYLASLLPDNLGD